MLLTDKEQLLYQTLRFSGDLVLARRYIDTLLPEDAELGVLEGLHLKIEKSFLSTTEFVSKLDNERNQNARIHSFLYVDEFAIIDHKTIQDKLKAEIHSRNEKEAVLL